MKSSLPLLTAGFLAARIMNTAEATPPLAAGTYDLHQQPKKWTLYTDPYNGNEIRVSGFSGLYPVPGQPNKFYTVTDRGPAPDYLEPIPDTNPPQFNAYKCWAIPEFGPHLIRFRLEPSGKAKIEDIRPLRRPDGTPITGLPTTKPATDIPYDFNLEVLPFDEDSLDAEGLTIDPWGNFWICEEYKPSVAMISPDGTVQLRLVPEGTLTGAEQVPTYDVLPGILSKRRNNRGFEGLAAASNGVLYSIMQRPLNNPSQTQANLNGNVRLVAIDLNVLLHGSAGPLVRQYLYRVPAPTPNNVTLSDLFSNAPGKLLISERVTDAIFEITLAGATDITPLENAAGKLIADPTQTIEQLDTAELAFHGITPLSKTAVMTGLTGISPLLEKVEGLCVVNGMLALTYDNDFNVAEAGSTPAEPFENGPFVQLELLGANHPKVWLVPMP